MLNAYFDKLSLEHDEKKPDTDLIIPNFPTVIHAQTTQEEEFVDVRGK